MRISLKEEFEVCPKDILPCLIYKGVSFKISHFVFRLIDLGDLYIEEDGRIVAGKYKAGDSCAYLSPTGGVMVISKDMKKEEWISSINDLGSCVLTSNRPKHKNLAWKSKRETRIEDIDEWLNWNLYCDQHCNWFLHR